MASQSRHKVKPWTESHIFRDNPRKLITSYNLQVWHPINRAPTGGGGVWTPPWVFFVIAKKTKARSAAVFCIAVRTTVPQLSSNLRSRWPKVRSPGQVKWSHLRKKNYYRVTATVVERKMWNFQDLVYYQVPTTCISRIFYIGYLRSGQFRDLSIISQWGKTKIPQIRIKSVQIVETMLN